MSCWLARVDLKAAKSWQKPTKEQLHGEVRKGAVLMTLFCVFAGLARLVSRASSMTLRA